MGGLRVVRSLVVAATFEDRDMTPGLGACLLL